ncbi:MAG: isochorismatase family protein [Micavibrio aeruginosavorus]|uniref:Isochorismatase family protein n=1 Tax=Micavibrio aeruginosavorus TaxID=349221 RepID=A0A7T5R3N9_9BACT|nr:MAG: isochorismatase family protein [Micavibrio aeruginosavorus]
MNQTDWDIQAIFEQGAQALAAVFRPGRVLHLGIDWQTLYCDPNFVASQCGDLKRTQKILTTLARMEKTIAELRPVLPTCWIHHDIPMHRSLLLDERILEGMDAGQTQSKLDELRAEANAICADVRPGDRCFAKLGYDSYQSPDLQAYLARSEATVHLLSGLVRNDCIRKSEKGGAARGYNMFVIEDLTVNDYEYTSEFYLGLYREAQRRGTHAVRAADVRSIAAQYLP